MSYRDMRAFASWALSFALSAAAVPGQAQVREPADTVNTSGFGPIPVDPRSFCKTGDTKVGGSIGCTGSAYTGDYVQYSGNTNTLENLSLIGLLNYYESDRDAKPMLDYALDAHAEPGTFSPLCNISAKLVLHGAGCFVDFGWYCADGTPNPTIHPLVSVEDIYAFATLSNAPYPASWKNNDGAFLPRVGYEVQGTPLSNVANDSSFKACKTKKIGFAVMGNSTKYCTSTAACACTQNKFTEQALNQVSSASNAPYINALTYASKAQPGRFYIAFEDLPASELQFDAPYVVHATSGDVTWQPDGDFNDFVYAVEGVVCDGSGQLCDVPRAQGQCAIGVTGCARLGLGRPCEPVFQPTTEVCNGLDDDCNGIVDDGENLCGSGNACDRGKCVHSCASTGEFACPTGQMCIAAGTCVEAICVNAACGAGQRCDNGQCVDDCVGVTCPAGAECHAGNCVDLCQARRDGTLAPCPDNFVCQRGACVPNCTCIPCPNTAQTCDADVRSPTYGQCRGLACTGDSCSTGGAPAFGGADALGGGAGTGGVFSAASGGSTWVIAAATGGAVTLGGSGTIGASTTNSIGTSILTGGAVSLGGNAAVTGGAATALGGNTPAASACEPGHETCPCYGNDTCNAGLTCASHLCVFLGTGGVGAMGGVANAGGQSLVTSGDVGGTNPSATQGSDSKSGCGCRSAGVPQRNLGALIAGVLAMTMLRRRARVRNASPRQARRNDRSMES